MRIVFTPRIADFSPFPSFSRLKVVSLRGKKLTLKLFADYKNHPVTEVNKSILWEFDLDTLDYQKAKNIIVDRVMQWGTKNDLYAILNIYGEEGVREAIKQIPFLHDEQMKEISNEFDIPVNEFKCYKKKQFLGRSLNF